MCLARRPRAQPGARLSHRAVHSATGSNGGAKYWGSFEEELGEWKGFEEKREHLPHAYVLATFTRTYRGPRGA